MAKMARMAAAIENRHGISERQAAVMAAA